MDSKSAKKKPTATTNNKNSVKTFATATNNQKKKVTNPFSGIKVGTNNTTITKTQKPTVAVKQTSAEERPKLRIFTGDSKVAEAVKGITVSKQEFTLDQLKAFKLAELRTEYKKVMKQSVTTLEGYNVKFDDMDIVRLGNYIELLVCNGEKKGYLTQADDNTVFDVGIDVLVSTKMQMMAQNSYLHGFKQYYKSKIREVTTVEDLDKIKFDWTRDEVE